MTFIKWDMSNDLPPPYSHRNEFGEFIHLLNSSPLINHDPVVSLCLLRARACSLEGLGQDNQSLILLLFDSSRAALISDSKSVIISKCCEAMFLKDCKWPGLLMAGAELQVLHS